MNSLLSPSDSAGELLDSLLSDLEQIESGQADGKIDETRGEFDLAPSISATDMQEGSPKLVPDICTVQDDYDFVFSEFLLGSTIRERAFYRIWRIRNSKEWDTIIGFGGERYRSFGNMVKDISSNEALGIGRQIIYDRMKLYDQLDWAGYSHGEIISKMSAKPSLYLRVFNKIILWDNEAREPISVKVDTDENLDEDETKAALRDLISQIESFPRQLDALTYVDENILNLPQVKVWLDGDAIVVDYVRTSVEDDGSVYIDDQGTVKFYGDSALPDWVLEKIGDKL